MKRPLKAVEGEIQDGHIKPVYLVIGDDDWSKQNILAAIKKKVLLPGMAEFNFDLFHASETPAVNVVDQANQLPMMADRRLIVVDECEQWLKGDLSTLAAYTETANEKTCLVLQFLSADRRKKIFQSSSTHVRMLELWKPKRWELPDYIRDLAQDMGLRMNREALEMVAELAGDDLARVHSELEKLRLFTLEADEIQTKDVEQLMGRTRQVTRWELGQFIGDRDLHAALRKVHDIFDSGEEAIGLLSAINYCLKQLFVVKALMIRGTKNRGEIGRVVGVPPRIAGDLMRQQQSYSDYELRRAFRLLKQADHRLKSSLMNRELLLDHLVSQILIPGELSPPKVRARLEKTP